MRRGNLVTEMSLVNDKLPHETYYQGLLKKVTTTVRLISILLEESFYWTHPKVSERINFYLSRLQTDHMKFMQFHLILGLYGGTFHIAKAMCKSLCNAIAFNICVLSQHDTHKSDRCYKIPTVSPNSTPTISKRIKNLLQSIPPKNRKSFSSIDLVLT